LIRTAKEPPEKTVVEKSLRGALICRELHAIIFIPPCLGNRKGCLGKESSLAHGKPPSVAAATTLQNANS